MVNFILVQLLIFLASLNCWARMDRIYSEGYLGEKRLDSYSERWQPLVSHDIYKGKMSFRDDLFLQTYFQNYLFKGESDLNFFLKSEINSGLTCSNELLSEHFDQIRYSYRLITLSYLMEAQWHQTMTSKHFGMTKACSFNFNEWISKCRPKSPEMKKFVSLVKKYQPKYEETLPKTYLKKNWWIDFSKNDYKYYSHYRLDTNCKGKCEQKDVEKNFKNACDADENLMTLICSEEDEIFGISDSPDAYHLIGISNIINTFNKQHEALGCLRRFSEVMAHKEVKYPAFINLFQTLRDQLQRQYQERFLQGRVFFYGSGKEFEDKGLKNLYVMEQPLKIAELDAEEAVELINIPKIQNPVKAVVVKAVKAASLVEKKEIIENFGAVRSAFLQAAEVRKVQDLEMVEVDMLKFKYDYIFSLNMINTLTNKLKNFMTRDALKEMKTFDKLGSEEGAVPLLFLKYMIDMQEHTGLYNLINVLGDEFYVSNEIDSAFKPNYERVKLINDESTGGKWQIYILRP